MPASLNTLASGIFASATWPLGPGPGPPPHSQAPSRVRANAARILEVIHEPDPDAPHRSEHVDEVSVCIAEVRVDVLAGWRVDADIDGGDGVREADAGRPAPAMVEEVA